MKGDGGREEYLEGPHITFFLALETRGNQSYADLHHVDYDGINHEAKRRFVGSSGEATDSNL